MQNNVPTLDNSEHLSNYYQLIKTHLKWSFFASICALFVGLAAILVGVIFILDGDKSLTPSLTAIGGVLTQFIGAGFFFLYTKNLKQLNVFYEKLIRHQDTEHAISLVESLPKAEKSAQVKSIINIIITRNEPPADITPEKLDALQRYNASQSN